MTSDSARRLVRLATSVATLVCLFVVSPRTIYAQLTPTEAAGHMGRGINLGNTLEPPAEGAWNNGPAQEYYFDEYVSAGFSTVRIPVRWDGHTSNSAAFTVNAAWMSRVEQLVNWALDRNLFVIINAHHEDWLKQNYADPVSRARFDSIWEQVSERFQNKSEKLFFEIINEPNGLTRNEVDELNERILGIIRQTNPTRIVIYSGNEYSNVDQLLAASIPDDPYIMAYFHTYDPWDFAGLGNGTWGTTSDRSALHQHIGRVVSWSSSNGIPVMLSEFGAVLATDYNSRMRFLSAYVEELVVAGFPFQVWDDGGDFEVMKRSERTWHESKDILIHTYSDGPMNFDVSDSGNATALLTWENRAAQNSIVVERALPGGEFEPLAELSSASTSYEDETAASGVAYRYRIIGKNVLMGDRHSYPLTITLSEARTGFWGVPLPVPGTIEAEDFDRGGEGVAYHDSDAINSRGAYRQSVGVDIEERDGGGFQVGEVEAGEWLEYTVDVETAGVYRMTAEVASLDGGGRIFFKVGNTTSPRLLVPATGSWQNTSTIEFQWVLEAGIQTLHLNVYSLPEYNIDRLGFAYVGATSVEAPIDVVGTSNPVSVYPNPAKGHITVRTDSSPVKGELSIYNALGRNVLKEYVTNPSNKLDVTELPPGWYMVVVSAEGHTVGKAPFISR